MREKDEMTDLFRTRLSGAGMEVRGDFWDTLQHDLSLKETERRKWLPLSPRYYRVAAAASVLFVLGAASAAFWYLSPKDEIKEAFTQVAALTPEASLNGDIVQESFPSIHQTDPVADKPGTRQPASGTPAAPAADAEDDESVSLRVSITITQRVYGQHSMPGNGYFNHRNPMQNRMYQTGGAARTTTDSDASDAAMPATDKEVTIDSEKTLKPRHWALKAAVGSSLPKSGFDSPFTAGVTVERRLNKALALEAGLQYNCLPADSRTLHTLAVPVKLKGANKTRPARSHKSTKLPPRRAEQGRRKRASLPKSCLHI